jgi:hypothetical protein
MFLGKQFIFFIFLQTLKVHGKGIHNTLISFDVSNITWDRHLQYPHFLANYKTWQGFIVHTFIYNINLLIFLSDWLECPHLLHSLATMLTKMHENDEELSSPPL